MTGSSGLTASACRLTEVQFRVVELGTAKRGREGGRRQRRRKGTRKVGSAGEGGRDGGGDGGGGEGRRLFFFISKQQAHPACANTHTQAHTNAQAYCKASLLLTVAELLRRGEYYPRGTSFTSSIFTEFLRVLRLLIIPAKRTYASSATTAASRTIFMSMSVVRVIIEIIMGCGWY